MMVLRSEDVVLNILYLLSNSLLEEYKSCYNLVRLLLVIYPWASGNMTFLVTLYQLLTSIVGYLRL